MNSKLLLIAALVLGCTVAHAQGKFTLSGNIKGVADSLVHISYMNGEKRVRDSVQLRNGQFSFTGTITEPVMVLLSLTSKMVSSTYPNYVSFFIEPGNIKFSANYNEFADAVITGSKVQDEYNIVVQERRKFDKRWKIVMDTLSAINKRSNALYQETKAWALSPYMEESREVTANFIRTHPKSYVTAWMLRVSYDFTTDSLKKLYAGFPVAVKQSSYGKALANEIEKRKTGIPGAKASPFVSMGIDGQNVSLESLKGKYVLIDFWASWCVPCRKGNPHLKELYAKYKEKGFEVVGISDDDRDPNAWKKAVEQDGLPWKHVLRGLKRTSDGNYDRSADISEGYNIHSLPTQILIDPKGMIVGRYGDSVGEPHEALDKKLEEVFK